MKPGKAFLLIVKDEGKTIDTGPGTSLSTIKEFQIDLLPGWNFIGNPFTFSIPVDSLRLSSSFPERDPPVLRFFDGASWNDPVTDPVEEMRPFEGYAVFTDTPDVVFINPRLTTASEELVASLAARFQQLTGCPVPLPLSISKSSPAREATAAPAAWSIRILAQSGPARDVDTRAVVSAGASPERDRLDRPEPPGLGPHVSVYFAHPEWRQAATRYSTDARPQPTDGAVWPLEITATAGGNVVLTFDGLEDVPPAFDVWLVDDLAQVSRNLRQQNTYTVAGTPAPRPLKLVVGRPGFLQNEVQASREVPTRFELFGNFPNPFNPATTIRYALPEASPVSLVIYNVLGEKVAVLEADAQKQAGYHAVVWDGRNAAGAPAASGLYVARMQAGRFAQTRTMLLVK